MRAANSSEQNIEMTESAPKRCWSLSKEAPSKQPALGTLFADPSSTHWNIDLPPALAEPPNLQLHWSLPHKALLDTAAIEKQAPQSLVLLWRAVGPGAVEYFVTSCFPQSPASKDTSNIALSLTGHDHPLELFMMHLHLATSWHHWELSVWYTSALTALTAPRHPYPLDELMSPLKKGEYAIFVIAMPLTMGHQSCGWTSSPLAPPSTNSAVYMSAGRR
jgi:hypothetical protein